MTTRIGAAAAILTLALASIACTGGSETNAAEESPKSAATKAEDAQERIDARRELESIGKAIPIYHGAQFNPDLSKRDEVTIRSQFGPNAEVFTLATDDSFPQVFHYYTTYLGQFGGFQPQDTYPPKQQNWRNLEVQLNQAMQDPFIPGQALNPHGRQVTLQIAETEAEPKTVIRYVVTPYAPPAAPAAAPPVAAVAAPPAAQPVTR